MDKHMAREMTPQDRAAAIVDKVKSELTPIWLGGRQRMLLKREIAEALIATRRAALLECREEISTLMGKDAGNWNRAIVYAADVANKLAQEGY